MRWARITWLGALFVLSAPVAAQAQSSTAVPKRVGSAAGAVLLVEGPGVVEVSASSLAEALDSTAADVSSLVRSGWLDLRLGGESIAWHAVDGGEALRFVTPDVRSPFSRDHRVRVSMEQGSTMPSRGLVPLLAGAPHTYLETTRLEENLFPGPSGAPDPRQDLFFWHALSSGAEVEIAVPLPALGAPSAAELRVYVHGATEHPDQPFRVELHWNGQSVGVFDRMGRARYTIAAALSGIAATPDNELVVQQHVAGDEAPVLYLDAVEVDYVRSAEADSPSFRFSGAADGVHSVIGLSANATLLYDVTDPMAPARYDRVVLNEQGGLRFATEGSDLRFVVATPESIITPVEIRQHLPTDLRGTDREVDYLIIAPAHLLAAAEALADYRAADGYRVLSVDIEDVYWEFADGEPDPFAIREFLAFATEHWRTGPRFVVLIGNGNLDYRDLMGHGENWLPPALAVTDGGLFPSDSMLADLVGNDGVPEIAMGRLPIERGEQLGPILASIESFEATHDSMDVLFASDDSQYDEFIAASRLLSAWVAPDRALEIDLTVETPDEARSRLLSMWSTLGWMTYVGHSSIDRMAAEGLVTLTDVAALAERSTTPVVRGWTCNMVRFDIPGFSSLGEQLLVEGASAGIFSATGWSNHFESDLLRVAFTEAVFDSDAETIGDAMLRAHRAAANASLPQHRVYLLLGDPALRIRGKARSDPEPPSNPDPPSNPVSSAGPNEPSDPATAVEASSQSATGCEIARPGTHRGPLGSAVWLLAIVWGARGTFTSQRRRLRLH